MLSRRKPTEPLMEHPAAAAERRATALDEINKMQQDLILSHDSVASLKRELERAEDRCVLVTEEARSIPPSCPCLSWEAH